MSYSEPDEELGYDKYDQSEKKTDYFKSRYFNKRMRSECDEINIKVSHDRNNEFEL